MYVEKPFNPIYSRDYKYEDARKLALLNKQTADKLERAGYPAGMVEAYRERAHQQILVMALNRRPR